MKLYLLNEYVGGTPFESKTLGIYLTIDEAKTELKKELEKYDIEYDRYYGGVKEIEDTSFYFDCDDWWGGCEIQEIETEFNLTK
tara:strand:+ start:2248 stop:2499 length:252 start_codon:yes stop_codon:yes gene_type:complete